MMISLRYCPTVRHYVPDSIYMNSNAAEASTTQQKPKTHVYIPSDLLYYSICNIRIQQIRHTRQYTYTTVEPRPAAPPLCGPGEVPSATWKVGKLLADSYMWPKVEGSFPDTLSVS